MAVVTGLGWALSSLVACTEHPGAAGHPEAVLPAALRDAEEDWGDQVSTSTPCPAPVPGLPAGAGVSAVAQTPPRALGWHCCASCRAGDAVLGLSCLAALAGLRAMRSRLPQAVPTAPLAVRISHLIVWICATGVSAVPCPVSSRAPLSGSGKAEPETGKGQAGTGQDLQVGQGGKVPRLLSLCPFLRLGSAPDLGHHLLPPS